MKKEGHKIHEQSKSHFMTILFLDGGAMFRMKYLAIVCVFTDFSPCLCLHRKAKV